MSRCPLKRQRFLKPLAATIYYQLGEDPAASACSIMLSRRLMHEGVAC